MTELPTLAAIGVTKTYGNNFDRFIAKGIQWATATEDQYRHWHNAEANHAVIFVGNVVGLDGPQIVEAAPGGANFSPWNAYGSDMIWINTPYQRRKNGLSQLPLYLTPGDRKTIAAFAKDCAIKKVGYNYMDFVAIALAQQRFGQTVNYANPPWWAKRLANDSRLICSQLVDYCYKKDDRHLFDDNRPSGLVSPADLLSLAG